MIPKSFVSMRVSHPPVKHPGGFTLIEIIVVVAIIGVMVAVLGVSMSRDSDRLARLEAKRFHAIVNEVRDEAILSGEAYFLMVDEKTGSYHFSGAQADRSTTFDDGLLRRRELQAGVGLRWQVLDHLNDEIDSPPKVLITPLGEVTPFETSFIGDENTYLVFVDEASQLAQRTEKTRLF